MPQRVECIQEVNSDFILLVYYAIMGELPDGINSLICKNANFFLLMFTWLLNKNKLLNLLYGKKQLTTLLIKYKFTL